MRRQYITHPRFQFAFTTSFVLGTFIIFALLGLSSVGTYKLLAHDPLMSESQRILLNVTAQRTLFLISVIGVVCLVAFAFIGIYLSYKFVGPLYRVESWLSDRLEKRNYEPMKLRPGDELEPIIHVLNRMVEKRFGKAAP